MLAVHIRWETTIGTDPDCILLLSETKIMCPRGRTMAKIVKSRVFVY